MKRVRATLEAAGITPDIRETALARTAQDAATALGCAVDQIAKSIVLRGEDSGKALLFVTAGAQQIDLARASALALAGEALGKAEAALIRAQTGFAIGGVAPVGHITPPRAWFDRSLLKFPLVWAAAGTPHHVFSLDPQKMAELSDAQVSDFVAIS
ncbi:YbaK/EbsC family protein [Sulfitobacter dubius]|uniref:YbaK/EbsC family protein n=1 Tax=Sulfitobacter dubius TaxID=218673 RepID=UPI0008E37358|nr:YbaK/EbsC family protein [Sulfitobacter dubius]SFG46568.1 Cys-tRNA(Pro) deacylase, prolyl-tRNA editing enzyme YbaK/EbsC [Sulfitobacter dubius]